MALTYNIENDICYNQGLEKGLEKGIEKGVEKGVTIFVKYLLLNTSHSVEEIAKLVNMPVCFVDTVKKQIGNM